MITSIEELPEKSLNPELHRVAQLAIKKGVVWGFERTEAGHHKVTLNGDGVKYIHDNLKGIAPKAAVSHITKDNGIVVVWEKGSFDRPAAEETKPKDSLPDEMVLSAVPRSIDSVLELNMTCRNLAGLIEKAYPSVLVSHRGYGRGKSDLLCNVLDRLHSVTGRHVNRAGAVILVAFLQHYQVAASARLEMVEMPPPPRTNRV